MNPFEMVVLIVALVMIAKVLSVRYQQQRTDPERENPETLRLREEVVQLKERVKVLERIATDSNHTLEREIEELRSRRDA
jgi:hypothetical protein